MSWLSYLVDTENEKELVKFLKGKGFKQTRVVRAHLGPDNISEDLDAKGKNRMLDALMNVKTGVLAKKWPYLQASGKAAAVEASVPFKKQVTQACDSICLFYKPSIIGFCQLRKQHPLYCSFRA